MKPRRQNVTISRRVTRSTTTLERNSLPLPDELVFEIYSRLPLKSIARCRCVCKLWSSILRRQDFTELFLTKSRARPQLLFVFKNHREIVFFSLPQPENPEDNSYVVASDHLARFPGIEYCCDSGFSCYGFNLILNREGKMVICNPSTGQLFNLPNLPRLKSRYRFGVESYLGYEPIAKEFKALSMERSYVRGEWISAKHQVLTFGTNKLSWRLVDCCVPHYSSSKWICISGVLYYTATANSYSLNSMVVCFDLRSEKLSFVNFMETFSGAMELSTTMVNYNGKLGLLMSRDYSRVTSGSKSLELWVLEDAEWSKHIYILPPSWKDVVTDIMCISGMVGTNEIVFSPIYQFAPSYVIYYNVESKTIRKVWIRGMEAFRGKRFCTYVNYVENVKLL